MHTFTFCFSQPVTKQTQFNRTSNGHAQTCAAARGFT